MDRADVPKTIAVTGGGRRQCQGSEETMWLGITGLDSVAGETEHLAKCEVTGVALSIGTRELSVLQPFGHSSLPTIWYHEYMRGDEWIEAEWDGTLADGLAPDDLTSGSYNQFAALHGRARINAELDDLATILGATVQYTDAVDASSEQHLTIGRVHLKTRQSAFDFLTQLTGLVIAIALMSPSGIVSALQLLRTVKRAVSILTAEELLVVQTVAELQRRGKPQAIENLDPIGERLLKAGVIEERDGKAVVAF